MGGNDGASDRVFEEIGACISLINVVYLYRRDKRGGIDMDYKALTIRLPLSLWTKAVLHKLTTGEPVSRLLVRLLEDYLNK